MIGDRLDITGARWGLTGAEAVLKLRALIKNGDLDTYWRHHTRRSTNASTRPLINGTTTSRLEQEIRDLLPRTCSSDAHPAVETVSSRHRPPGQVGSLGEELRQPLRIRGRPEHVRGGPLAGNLSQQVLISIGECITQGIGQRQAQKLPLVDAREQMAKARVGLDTLGRPAGEDHFRGQQVGSRIHSVDVEPVITRRGWFAVFVDHGPHCVVIVGSSKVSIDNSHAVILAPTTQTPSGWFPRRGTAPTRGPPHSERAAPIGNRPEEPAQHPLRDAVVLSGSQR
jgi:hypothetical protein